MRRAALLLPLVLVSAFACNNSGDKVAPSATAAAPSASAAVPAGSRLVTIAVTDQGFTPAAIPAKRGESLVLRFTRTADTECLKVVAIPDLGVKQELPLNKAVDVPVKADKDGKINFQCWMGMFKGSIDVSS